MSDNVKNVDSSTWQAEVAQSPIPVLVDFWAEWCGPCRMVAPVLDDLSTELTGKLKIVKVNVDQSPDLAGQYGIRSIPTLLLLKGGVVAQQMAGAMTKSQLKAKLEGYV
jgi:thioredoxin 1